MFLAAASNEWVLTFSFAVRYTGETRTVSYLFDEIPDRTAFTVPDIDGVCEKGEVQFRRGKNSFGVWTAPVVQHGTRLLLPLAGKADEAARFVDLTTGMEIMKDTKESAPSRKAIRKQGWLKRSIADWSRGNGISRPLFGLSAAVTIHVHRRTDTYIFLDDDDFEPLVEAFSCSWCWGTARKVCQKCRVAYYCDKMCQVLDWNSHKMNCH